MEPILPKLVHPDQNGFVQGGQGYHNILRRVLNILFEKSGSPGHAVLSLDAEEDFDRIEWRYLFKILDGFGLGGNFLKLMQLLYSNPQTRVPLNPKLCILNIYSDNFVTSNNERSLIDV